MIFKNLVLLSILLNFNYQYVYSTSISPESSSTNTNSVSAQHPICEITTQNWISNCDWAISILKMNPKTWFLIYPDYEAYINSHVLIKCGVIKTENSPGNIIDQEVLFCYIRKSIVISSNSNFQQIFDNGVAIFPEDDQSMMIFERELKETRLYELKGMYKNFAWKNIYLTPPHIIQHPFPIAMEVTRDYLEKLVLNESLNFNKNNIVKVATLPEFIKLCSWVYGRAQYLDYFEPVIHSAMYNNVKPEPVELEVHVQQPIDKKPIVVRGYTCLANLNNKQTNELGYSLKILPGVLNNEILLLEAFMVNRKFKMVMVKPLEIIVNLDIEYLRYVP